MQYNKKTRRAIPGWKMYNKESKKTQLDAAIRFELMTFGL